jgi:hypothetical protein
VTAHRITLPEDRALRAFIEHPDFDGKWGVTTGHLLGAIWAYRDALIELGYLSRDAMGMAPDPVVDIRERAAINQSSLRGSE